MRVLGLDILPDRRSFFCVVIDSDTNEILFRGVVRREDLASFIEKHSIDTVAIDNIFELYEDSESIIRFLEETGVTLIQVTGPLFRQRKLISLAREYGLHDGTKLSPEQAAEIAAKIALSRGGAEVLAFREATLITVSRSRSFGVVGGSHQKHYLRAAEARIKAVVRDIQRVLNENNIPYDIFIREGGGGYKSAKIVVYEHVERIRKIIKEGKTDWYQIRLEPIRHNRIIFVDSSESNLYPTGRYIIVGVDPGETTGIAILDLNGNILYIGSRRSIGFFELIDKIYEYGKPLIVSCDVPKIPHFVKMLANRAGAIIFKPNKTITVAKKNEIVRKVGIKVGDSHQRDALVAALIAYKHYERKFSKVDNLARYIPFISADAVKAEIILRNIDIRSAILMQLSRFIQTSQRSANHVSHREIALLRENQVLREKYVELKSRFETLIHEHRKLKRQLLESERRISELEKELEKLRKEHTKKIFDDLKQRDVIVQKLSSENEMLRKRISGLEDKVRELESMIEVLGRIARRENDEIVVKKISPLSYETASSWLRVYGLTRYDLILTQRIIFSTKLLEILKSKTLGIILMSWDKTSSETIEILETNGIPVFDYEDFSDIIDKNMLVQRVKIPELSKRIREILIERFEGYEQLYEEFVRVLEEYRKKRIESYFGGS